MNHFPTINALVSPSPSPSQTLPPKHLPKANNEGYSPPSPPPMVSRSSKTRVLSYSSIYDPEPMYAPTSEPTYAPTSEPTPPNPYLEPTPPPPNPYLEPFPSPQNPYLGPSPPPSSPPNGLVEAPAPTLPISIQHCHHKGLVVGVALGFAFIIFAVVLVVVYRFCSKKRQRSSNTNNQIHVSTTPVYSAQDKTMDNNTPVDTPRQSNFTESNGRNINMSSLSRPIDITFEEISKATNNFFENNLLGQGGFGKVYKGVLSSETLVAVKQLKAESHQGEKEFEAEIDIISSIHHRNLVSLVGYIVEGSQRLLVYEFMANGSLDQHLHGSKAKTLTWKLRLQIAIDTAKGLAYLHEDCEPKIIHRDIKAANILLDSNYKAKVSDFGLARFVADFETYYISSQMIGTLGYLAPECTRACKFTEKSDVYAFGVVLIEILSGRKAYNHFTHWAMPLLLEAMKSGSFDGLADAKLQKKYENDTMMRMVVCAWACINLNPHERPRMNEIVQVLQGVKSPNDLKMPQGSISQAQGIMPPNDLKASESTSDILKNL